MKYKTDINIILDRSGSMGEIDVYKPTLIGFNHFLSQQKELTESARINLYKFNTFYEVVYTDIDVKLAPELTSDTFRPDGGTALLDAIGKTINDVGARLRNMKEADRPQQVIIVVITDGEENSSHEFTKTKVEEMIRHQTDVYKWQFVYIGANLEAIQAGYEYKSFGNNFMDREELTSGGLLLNAGEHMVSAFNKLGKSVKSYRGSNVAQVDNLVSLDKTENSVAAQEVKEILASK